MSDTFDYLLFLNFLCGVYFSANTLMPHKLACEIKYYHYLPYIRL